MFTIKHMFTNNIDNIKRGKWVVQEGWSYIKDSGNFIKKLKNSDHIPQDAIMVIADVVGS